MTSELASSTAGNVPPPLDQLAEQLIGIMMQGNPPATAAAVQYVRSFYGEQIAALVLDTTGRRIAQAQQVWARATQNWFFALQQLGLTPENFPAHIQQITQQNAAQANTSPAKPA